MRMIRGGDNIGSGNAEGKKGSGLVQTLVIIMVVVILLPVAPLIIISLSHTWFYPTILPDRIWTGNWELIFTSSRIIDATVNSFIIAIAVTIVSILIALPGAMAIGKWKVKGGQSIKTLAFLPTIIPSVAIGLGFMLLFVLIGLDGTVLGVILVHLVICTPYMLLVLSAVFETVDVDAEEQARSLGAGPLKTFYHVTLPAITPGLAIGSLFVFLVSLREFALTYLIGKGMVTTLPTVLFQYVYAEMNLTMACATSLFLAAPGVLFLLLTSKKISRNEFELRF